MFWNDFKQRNLKNNYLFKRDIKRINIYMFTTNNCIVVYLKYRFIVYKVKGFVFFLVIVANIYWCWVVLCFLLKNCITNISVWYINIVCFNSGFVFWCSARQCATIRAPTSFIRDIIASSSASTFESCEPEAYLFTK
mgnify:CR=1 FL=1